MARQKFEKSFNTFVKGLMTEASEINFPENYSLYEKNFELRRDGGRDRRRGMDLLYPLGVVLTSKPYVYYLSEDISVAPTFDEVFVRDVIKELGVGPEHVSVGPLVSEAIVEDSILRSSEEVVVGPVLTTAKTSELMFHGEEIGNLTPVVVELSFSVLYEFAEEEVAVSPIISEVELI